MDRPVVPAGFDDSNVSTGRLPAPGKVASLVDAAHARGISVFLDIVYNHFGPDGNYLAVYAPLFSDRHKTPWGNGINYDGEDSRPVWTTRLKGPTGPAQIAVTGPAGTDEYRTLAKATQSQPPLPVV